MEVTEVLELVRAGFTAEQIAGMTAASKGKHAKPEPPEPTEEQTKQQPNDGEPPAGADALLEKLSAISARLDEFERTTKAANIRNDAQPLTKQESVEDILTSIINPYKEG